MSKNTKKLLASIAERAIKTLAQTYVAIIGANVTEVLTVTSLDAIKISLGAAILSVMTSISSLKFGPNGISLAKEVIPNDEVGGH